MRILDTLANTLAELLEADERRVLLGEDVRDGTSLGWSREAVRREHLRARVIATPLTPATTIAHACGIALAGRRPIVLFPAASALLEGFAALRETAKVAFRYGDRRRAPVLFVVPFGPGFGTGDDAAEAIDSTIVHLPGLRVVCAAELERVDAMLRAAADFRDGDDPTVLLIPRTVLLDDAERIDGTSIASLHACRTLSEGDHCTVFAWGATVEIARAAIERTSIATTLIDVASLAPLDRKGLLQAARATGKIVIVHSGSRHHGLGNELAALFADEAILFLDAPVLRIAGADGHVAARDEFSALPSIERVAEAIHHVATF